MSKKPVIETLSFKQWKLIKESVSYYPLNWPEAVSKHDNKISKLTKAHNTSPSAESKSALATAKNARNISEAYDSTIDKLAKKQRSPY